MKAVDSLLFNIIIFLLFSEISEAHWFAHCFLLVSLLNILPETSGTSNNVSFIASIMVSPVVFF